jgi:hypothetical protein
MLSQILKPTAARSTGVLGQVTKNRTQARFLASVQTNTARQIPTPARKATPVTLENATFTIKVRSVLSDSIYFTDFA